MAKKKYYVVWEGFAPGVYDSWDEAQAQVDGFPGARYKAYADAETAIAAFRGEDVEQLAIFRAITEHASKPMINYAAFPDIRTDAIAVDAACSRNPGPVEYRGVRVDTGEVVFSMGPLPDGTNNIGEYLALIHAAALLAQRDDAQTPIYTDSRTALAWLRAGHSRTTLQPTASNERIRELLRRADAWLATHRIPNPILKWNTEAWGEIPADYDRK